MYRRLSIFRKQLTKICSQITLKLSNNIIKLIKTKIYKNISKKYSHPLLNIPQLKNTNI